MCSGSQGTGLPLGQSLFQEDGLQHSACSILFMPTEDFCPSSSTWLFYNHQQVSAECAVEGWLRSRHSKGVGTGWRRVIDWDTYCPNPKEKLWWAQKSVGWADYHRLCRSRVLGAMRTSLESSELEILMVQVRRSLRRNAHSRPLPLPVSPRLYVVESRALNDRADSGESRARRVDILPCDRTD